MTHCNRLSEVSYNEEIASWRFRVKIHRIYPFYSYVTGSGPHWTYILADEDGTKMEMTIYGRYEDRFRGLEKQEENGWKSFGYLDVSNRSENTCLIDTMGVVFNTESHFDDPASPKMVFYIRDNIESRIKCVATGDHAYAFRDGFENMRGYFGSLELWLETEGGLSDFRFNPHFPEVEEFIQSVNNSDPYIRRHGAIGPL
ncbi:hypothetical protein F2Q69_00021727 [Brassica cretica]|uniref:Replication protein A 70 kDa DNA-binding subunit B/D first OB fold domain-containing protein n=1 Tax=Brassica cretica TaxID=69181 RepID=A0A8S9Q0W3_BRACR|nr:hypothetical protein F2Q69_00021727 [Brassica cretica]